MQDCEGYEERLIQYSTCTTQSENFQFSEFDPNLFLNDDSWFCWWVVFYLKIFSRMLRLEQGWGRAVRFYITSRSWVKSTDPERRYGTTGEHQHQHQHHPRPGSLQLNINTILLNDLEVFTLGLEDYLVWSQLFDQSDWSSNKVKYFIDVGASLEMSFIILFRRSWALSSYSNGALDHDFDVILMFSVRSFFLWSP